MKRIFMIVIVVGLVLAAPTAASAAELGPGTARAEGFDPSPSKWREYMLNTTSKILRGLTGGRADLTGSWQREYIANQFRYSHSLEALHQATGIPQYMRDANGVLRPYNYTGSYDQAVIDKIDADNKAKKRYTSFRLVQNATRFQKFVGGVLGPMSATTLVPLVGQLGSGVIGGWMGYDDVNEQWCRTTADWTEWYEELGAAAFGFLTGKDCSMFDFADTFIANEDMPEQVIGSVAGVTFLGKVGSTLCYRVPPGWSLPPGYMTQDRSITTGIWSNANGTQAGHYNCMTDGTVIARNGNFSLPGLRLVSLSSGEVVEQHTIGKDNPERVLECVITLADGSEVRSEAVGYQETDGTFVPPSCPPVPPEETPVSVSIGEVGSSSPPLFSEEVDPDVVDWWETYPECREGMCVLDLKLKSGGVVGVSCFDLNDGCPGWWEDPSKASKYQCTYGVHNVDIEECAVYASLFEPGRVEVGAPYSDPMTGDWSGGSNAPSFDKQAMSQKIQNPAEGRACTGLAITGFDPVGFVLRPIQCALEWAFVPRPLVVEAELAGGEVAWEGKPPAVLAEMVGSFAPAPSAVGCSRTVTIFTGQFEQSVTPLNACPGSPLEPVAAISRIVTAAGMVVLVVTVLRRQVAGMVGYGSGQ